MQKADAFRKYFATQRIDHGLDYWLDFFLISRYVTL